MNPTDEEIRIKVAETIGIRFVPAGGIFLSNAQEVWPDHWEDSRGQRRRIDGSLAGIPVALPNYPESLDACAEFEATLTDEEWPEYTIRLSGEEMGEGWPTCFLNLEAVKLAASATARQRCIAYLKTKGIIP